MKRSVVFIMKLNNPLFIGVHIRILTENDQNQQENSSAYMLMLLI